jgi:hypothetical protein
MTDEALCNALRYEKWDEAADRIEALTAERDAWKEQYAAEALGLHVQMQRAEAAEVKLAKVVEVVEALREIAEFAEKEWVTPSGKAPADVQHLCDIARATLAEIEGEQT